MRCVRRCHPILWFVGAGFVFLAPLVCSSIARAASSLPVHDVAQVDFPSWGQVYTIDLGTLPTRPWIIVEVASSEFVLPPLLTAQIVNWNLGAHPGPNCPAPSTAIANQSLGTTTVAFSLNNCDPRPGLFAGQSADVYVQVAAFSLPGQVSITIRGETRPPTGTLVQSVDPANVPLQVVLPASKDTVVYAENPTASNGAGPFLWAGDQLGVRIRNPRRSLVAFDVNGNIPAIATVLEAELHFTVTSPATSGQPLTIRRVLPGPDGSWGEGNAVAPGDGFVGVASPALFAADWLYRARPQTPWITPGVDVVGTLLGTVSAFPGNLSLTGPELGSAVQTMILDGSGAAGFVLSSSDPTRVPVSIQLASREHPDVEKRPQLSITYSQPTVYESGNVSTNVVNFINEGQNFRWVYDVSVRDAVPDGRFTTDNGGICQVVAPSDPPRFVPYTYGFQGSPSFTGVDCCTWRVESPQTGTVGTGQALFFHGLDASNPANMPPDSDLDGIRDVCDNCPARANGPLYGTCLIGLLGSPCHSNGECGPGGKCNLSQEDSNGDFVGNVCAVPEPGIALGLGAGVLALAFSRRAPAARAGDPRSSSGS